MQLCEAKNRHNFHAQWTHPAAAPAGPRSHCRPPFLGLVLWAQVIPFPICVSHSPSLDLKYESDCAHRSETEEFVIDDVDLEVEDLVESTRKEQKGEIAQELQKFVQKIDDESWMFDNVPR